MEVRDTDGHKLTLKLICPTCKKVFYSRPSRLGKGKTSKHCSVKCYHKRGSTNPKWRGGKTINPNGYVLVYHPNHPSSIQGRILEHRFVMEKKIGRYLKSGEIVHHINGKKDDNRPENLELINNSSNHTHIHKPRILKKCKWCGKKFFRKENPYLRRNDWSKTCSRSCGAFLRWSSKYHT